MYYYITFMIVTFAAFCFSRYWKPTAIPSSSSDWPHPDHAQWFSSDPTCFGGGSWLLFMPGQQWCGLRYQQEHVADSQK